MSIYVSLLATYSPSSQGELTVSWDSSQSSVSDATIASALSGGLEVDGGPMDPNGNGSFPGETNCSYGGVCEVWDPNQMGGKGAWALPSEADAYPPMAQIVFPQVGALVATPYKVLAGAFYAETAILGGAVLYSAGLGTMGLIRAAVPRSLSA